MTQLLVIREYIKNFYTKYEEFIVPLLKFVLGLILFLTINGRMGYMEKIDHVASRCQRSSIRDLPHKQKRCQKQQQMRFRCKPQINHHTYALSAECVVVLLLAYIIVLVIYLRFAPKAHLLLLFTPRNICQHIIYHYAACNRSRSSRCPEQSRCQRSSIRDLPHKQKRCQKQQQMRFAVAGGVVVYYVLAYITGNAQAFGGGESDTMLQRFSDMGTGVIENKEMLIVVTAVIHQIPDQQNYDICQRSDQNSDRSGIVNAHAADRINQNTGSCGCGCRRRSGILCAGIYYRQCAGVLRRGSSDQNSDRSGIVNAHAADRINQNRCDGKRRHYNQHFFIFDHAGSHIAVAVLVGTLADIVILLIGDLMYDANFSLAGGILGSFDLFHCSISLFSGFALPMAVADILVCALRRDPFYPDYPHFSDGLLSTDLYSEYQGMAAVKGRVRHSGISCDCRNPAGFALPMAVADILVCALRRDPFYPLLRHCHCHFGNRFYIVIILIIFKLHFFGARIIQIELEKLHHQCDQRRQWRGRRSG